MGPRAFTAGEVLHGRDREVADLCDLVIAERVVLLYSPSGAGKSSLLAAGLLPRLRAEGFAVRPPARVGHESPDMQAGANRFVLSVLLSLEEDVPADRQLAMAALGTTTLAAYLERRRREDGVDADVIVIDQFEEVLTADPSAHAARIEFFAQLGAALRDTGRYAVLAMREDWVAALDPYRGAVPTRLRTTFRLDLLGPEGARAAVQAPARAAGVEFTDAAAHKLVDDLRQIRVQRPDGSIELRSGPHVEPVQLQVVCLDLWAHLGAAARIDVASLGAVGDVDHALADYYAEQTLQIATDREVPERVLRAWVARNLITEQGLRGQVLRTPGSTQGLADEALQDLVDAHLLRAEARRGASWLELAHDRLVAPILASNAGWALAHTEPAQRQAALWDGQGRPEHLLLLDEAGLERAARLPEMSQTPVEREFIAQSRRTIKRRARERRNVRFIRVLAVCALFGLVTASVFAERSRRAAKAAVAAREEAIAAMLVAQEARDSLRAATQVTLSRQLAAQSQLLPRTESERAGLLAVASSKLSSPAEARATLISLLARWPRLAGGLGRSTPVYDIAVAATSGVMLSNGRDQGLAAWDLQRRERLWQHALLFARSAPAVAPQGDVVAVALATGQIAVQSVATGEDVAAIDVSLPAGDAAVAVAFTPDGEALIVGTRAGTVLAVSRAGAPLWRRERALAEVAAIACDRDGVLVVDAVGVHRLDRADGRRTASMAASGPVQAVAVAPGRPWAALALTDGSRVEFFDLSHGTRRALVLGSAVTVPALAIGPRGAVAAVRCQVGCVSAEAVVWAAGDESPQLVVPLPTLAPTALGFDLGEKRLIVGTAVEPPLLFDVEPLPELPVGVEAAAFSADGARLAVAGAKLGLEVWGVEPLRPLQALGPAGTPRSLRFVGDARLAVVEKSGEVAVWDLERREVLQRRGPPAPGIATELAETAEGALLAATTLGDGRVLVWDASTGAQLHALQASEAGPADAAWGPDGLLVTAACGLGDGRCSWTAPRTWHTGAAEPAGASLTVGQGRVDLLTVAPDGGSLVARNGSGLERWDLTTGAVVERPLDAGGMLDLEHAPGGDVLVAAGAAATACASGLCTHGRLRLFDAATLEPIGAPMLDQLAGDSMRLLAISPGDLQIVVQSGPETALWSFDVATLRGRVCAMAGRELTPEEWERDLARWGPQRPVCADTDAWPEAPGADAP